MVHNGAPRARATTAIQAWRIGLAAAFCVIWELVARNVTSLLLPSASATVVALAELLATADLWRALLTSHESLLVGFAAASLIGVPAGLALGLWPRVARWFDPHLELLMVTPMSAIIPLIILAAGLSVWSRAFVVFAFALPVVVVSAEAGMREADQRLVDMARTFGASRGQVIRRVLVPAAWPAVFAGLRLGLGRAFSGMVVSELVLMAAGVGGLLLRFQADFDAASIYALVIIVVLEAVALMTLGERLERRLLAWKRTDATA